MAWKKAKEQIKHNMSQVRNSDTALEKLLCEEVGPLWGYYLHKKQ